MTAKIVGVVAVALLAWGVGTLFITKIPPGFQDPWQFRVLTAVTKAITYLLYPQEFLYGTVSVASTKRRVLEYLISPAPDDPRVKKIDVKVDDVSVRIFEPEDKQENGPAVIFFHGGGWTAGSINIYDNLCYNYALNLSTVIISVEYRLAPEHVFPAAIDDCFIAARHFLKKGRDYGINPTRIALAGKYGGPKVRHVTTTQIPRYHDENPPKILVTTGDSAGGNLAAAVALRLRDENITPQPKLQLLIYPATQAIDFSSPSFMANMNDVLLSKHAATTCWLLYAVGHVDYLDFAFENLHTSPRIKQKYATTCLNHKLILSVHPDINYREPDIAKGEERVWKEIESIFLNPYFAPAMAEDLSGLPEAIVVTMEQDVLRDDGIWYANMLKDAGNTVTHIDYKSGYHGMISFGSNMINAREVTLKLYDLIKQKL